MAGRAWAGEGSKIASDGKTLVSADGLRQYRPPSFKPSMGRRQANFESRLVPRGQWQSNGHLDIVENQ
jgi:filamentous hemagglutinin